MAIDDWTSNATGGDLFFDDWGTGSNLDMDSILGNVAGAWDFLPGAIADGVQDPISGAWLDLFGSGDVLFPSGSATDDWTKNTTGSTSSLLDFLLKARAATKPTTGTAATKAGYGLSNLLGLSSGTGNTLGAIFGGLAAYDAIQANKRAAANAQNLMAQQRSPHYTAGLEAAQWAVPRGRSIASTRTPSRFAGGGYLKGGTAGQDDLIPALLSDGEYVIDAETVSMLGDGNNEAGADRLDQMRMKIRGHKRGASDDEIAPRAKEVHEYLGKGA